MQEQEPVTVRGGFGSGRFVAKASVAAFGALAAFVEAKPRIDALNDQQKRLAKKKKKKSKGFAYNGQNLPRAQRENVRRKKRAMQRASRKANWS